MTPARWQQIDALLQAGLALPAGERAEFLARSCAPDEELRAEVESLIASHEKAGDFLSEPAVELAVESIVAHAQELTNQLVNHYRIIAPLGAGGMGEVYLAEDTKLGRRVALKLLPNYFNRDENRLRRFEQEARVAATLTHPNICVIHEVGSTELGSRFIAMEYVDGVTLRERMNEGQLGVGEALNIALQVATGLSKAHAAGIVHRDIKPENVMLSNDGYVKVLDFGIAKLCETKHGATSSPLATNPGMILGTTPYMSPEQVRGFEVDARSDVWSLGVLLYEMVCGRSPFAGDTSSDCIAAILERQPPPVAETREDAPPDFQQILDRTLQKNPDKRYQNVQDFLQDLGELGLGRDVHEGLNGSPSATFKTKTKTVNQSARRTRKEDSVRGFPTHLLNYLVAHRLKFSLILASAVVFALMAWKFFPARTRTINSLAVLPFVNVNGDLNSDYIADGITDNLINTLSRLPNVKVIARNSVFRYKVSASQSAVADPRTVARELGVQAVLIGRIAQRGDHLVISAELIDAGDNSHLWGAQYNRSVADVFGVQEQIASDISRELRIRPGGEDRKVVPLHNTSNAKAVEAYTRGRAYLDRRTREDLLKAKAYYEQAIQEDGTFALAYAGLAEVYANLSARGYVPPAEAKKKFTEAARTAVQLDENLAEAHVAMSHTYMSLPFDFPDANRELMRAIELNPNLAQAHFYFGLSLLRQGRLDQGLDQMLKARELDPLSVIIARQFALYYYLKRDYSRALQTHKQVNEISPAFTTASEIGVYLQQGLYEEALAELKKAEQERKDDPLLIFNTAMVYAAQGRRTEAVKLIQKLEKLSGNEFNHAYWIAKIYAVLKDKEQALAWLERVLLSGTIAPFYRDEPVWDELRGDSRFTDLLKRMGVPAS